ncbi:uncharacterized protein BP5553_10565 [Venustampulla echinocandica]|uniref:Uncharacterized protein n=1 Tax=Venustampulla echinocandica TaxID=2656787 RepID=A0A370T8X4_9HELO|nr:uncharacterized protein BP5553_10565 [Venustampulla echinocandica]RDL29938.1 hypothetical protein BP5553_10565 [Venustampulla echinocandica]
MLLDSELEDITIEEKKRLIGRLKLSLAIIENRKLGQLEAEDPFPSSFQVYRWTFNGPNGLPDDFPVVHIPKANPNVTDGEDSDAFELQQHSPAIDNWSVADLRKLEISLNEHRVAVSLLQNQEVENHKTPHSNSLIEQAKPSSSAKNQSRAYHRVRSRLFQAIKDKTGHHDIPRSNPLISYPGPPYSFAWTFSPEYPRFPKIKGGISRWNRDQFHECEHALDSGYLTVRDLTNTMSPETETNREENHTQLVGGDISNLEDSCSTADLPSFVGSEATKAQQSNSLLRSHGSQLENSLVGIMTPNGEEYGNRPQPHRDDVPCHGVVVNALRIQINKVLENAKELEMSWNQRQSEKIESLQRELRDAYLQIENQTEELRARMANDQRDVAVLIAKARKEGEHSGRASAIQDMDKDRDGLLVTLRTHYLNQIEEARKQSYQDGFQAGSTSGQVLDRASSWQTAASPIGDQYRPTSQSHAMGSDHVQGLTLCSEEASQQILEEQSVRQQPELAHTTTSVDRASPQIEGSPARYDQNGITLSPAGPDDLPEGVDSIIGSLPLNVSQLSLPSESPEHGFEIKTLLRSLALPTVTIPLGVRSFPLSFIQKHIGRIDQTFTKVELWKQQKQAVRWPVLINPDCSHEIHEYPPRLGANGALTSVDGIADCGTIGAVYPVIRKVDIDAYQYIGHYKIIDRKIMPTQSWFALPRYQKTAALSTIRYSQDEGRDFLSKLGINLQKPPHPTYLRNLFESESEPYLRMSWTILQLDRFDTHDYETLVKISEQPNYQDSTSTGHQPVPISKELYDQALPRWIEVSLARYQNSTKFFDKLPLTPSAKELLSDAIRKHADSAGKFGKAYKTPPQIRNLKLYISGLVSELSARHFLGLGFADDVAAILRIFTAVYERFMFHLWHNNLNYQSQQDATTVPTGNSAAVQPPRRVSEGYLRQKRDRPEAQSKVTSPNSRKRRRHTAHGLLANAPIDDETPSIQLGQEILDCTEVKDDSRSDIYDATPPPAEQ